LVLDVAGVVVEGGAGGGGGNFRLGDLGGEALEDALVLVGEAGIDGGTEGDTDETSGGVGSVEGTVAEVNGVAVGADRVLEHVVEHTADDEGSGVLADILISTIGQPANSDAAIFVHVGVGTHFFSSRFRLDALLQSIVLRGLIDDGGELSDGVVEVRGGVGELEGEGGVEGGELGVVDVDTGEDEALGSEERAVLLQEFGGAAAVVVLREDVAGVAEGLLVEGDGLEHVLTVFAGALPAGFFEEVIEGITEAFNIRFSKFGNDEAGVHLLNRSSPVFTLNFRVESEVALVDFGVVV